MIPPSAPAQPNTQLPLNLREKSVGPLLVNCGYCGRGFRIFPERLTRQRIRVICCSPTCAGLLKTGASNSRFIGEPRLRPSNGYMFVSSGIAYQKSRREHVLIAEATLGRALKKGEVVHHINLNPTDNRRSNLLICTQSYHAWLHTEMARLWALEHLPQRPPELIVA